MKNYSLRGARPEGGRADVQDHAHGFVANFDRVPAISHAEHVVEVARRIVLDLLDDPAHLDVSVLVLRICDRERDPGLPLNVLVVMPRLGMGQLDDLICRIPQEPHGVDLRRAVLANRGEVGEQRPLE